MHTHTDTQTHVYTHAQMIPMTRSVTLKPNVAFAMLHMAGMREGMSRLDPSDTN